MKMCYYYNIRWWTDEKPFTRPEGATTLEGQASGFFIERSNMKLTVNWLMKKNACQEGIEWFKKQDEKDPIKLIKWAIKNKKYLDWANWLIVRIMKYKQYVSYAVYAAEQVLDIFENEYPADKKPRKAIEAAKKCIKYPSKENKRAAADAAIAAAADAAAYAADAAIAAAAYAADAAAYAAIAAAYAADAADAAIAAAAVKIKLQVKILRYGLNLLQETTEAINLIENELYTRQIQAYRL